MTKTRKIISTNIPVTKNEETDSNADDSSSYVSIEGDLSSGEDTESISETSLDSTIKDSTQQILNALQIANTAVTLAPKPLGDPLYETCIMEISPPPPAGIKLDKLIISAEKSAAIKAAHGVKHSAHPVHVVSIPDACDFLFIPDLLDIDYKNLPGKGYGCYLMTRDEKLYYADKKIKRCMPLKISVEDFYKLMIDLDCSKSYTQKQLHLIENLSKEDLHNIFIKTQHMHGMCFYKENTKELSLLECANATAYQLLAPFHAPMSLPILNQEDEAIGVLSKALTGFIPNRIKPLQISDIDIPSLNGMIKKRSNIDIIQLNKIFRTLSPLSELLDRTANPNDSYAYQFFSTCKNLFNYYAGAEHNAVQIKPKLEAFSAKVKKGEINKISFGELEELRKILTLRRENTTTILENLNKNNQLIPDYYVAKKKLQTDEIEKYQKELDLLNESVERLNLMLLDDVALFIKNLRTINAILENNWIDIQAEITNPWNVHNNWKPVAKEIELCFGKDCFDSVNKKFKISLDLEKPLVITLNDIQNFRNQRGLAMGLTARYFLMDPDNHNKNIGSDWKKKGCVIDFDEAGNPLTHLFKNPGQINNNNFVLDKNDYSVFPYAVQH